MLGMSDGLEHTSDDTLSFFIQHFPEFLQQRSLALFACLSWGKMKILDSSLTQIAVSSEGKSTVNPALEEGFADHCLNSELCWQTQQRQHYSTTAWCQKGHRAPIKANSYLLFYSHYGTTWSSSDWVPTWSLSCWSLPRLRLTSPGRTIQKFSKLEREVLPFCLMKYVIVVRLRQKKKKKKT